VRKNANVKGRWHDNRHTLITELAESGAGDQTIMDIAGHVSKQVLKHYSHIRMEAKRRALEAIVDRRPARRPIRLSKSLARSPQKYPHGLQNGSKRAGKNLTATKNEKTWAADNSKRVCLEIPANTQHFEGEYPQKSPQFGVF
jgi:hypothetical protein